MGRLALLALALATAACARLAAPDEAPVRFACVVDGRVYAGSADIPVCRLQIGREARSAYYAVTDSNAMMVPGPVIGRQLRRACRPCDSHQLHTIFRDVHLRFLSAYPSVQSL